MATTKQGTKQPAQQAAAPPEVAAVESAQKQMKAVEELLAMKAAAEKAQAEKGEPKQSTPDQLTEEQEAENAAAKEAEDQKDAADDDAADDDDEPDEPEVQESKVAAKENLKLTPEDEQVLDRLAKLWQPVTSLDLKARHEMGVLILKTYYSGIEGRAKYGDKIMKIAEIRLDIPSSELHRMKNFAEKFSDLDAFLKQHPDATNWSRVKRDYLPKKKSSRKRNEWVARVEQLDEILDELIAEQAKLRKHVAPAMLEDLSKKLTDVSKVVALVIIPGQVFDAAGKPIGVQQPATT